MKLGRLQASSIWRGPTVATRPRGGEQCPEQFRARRIVVSRSTRTAMAGPQMAKASDLRLLDPGSPYLALQVEFCSLLYLFYWYLVYAHRFDQTLTLNASNNYRFKRKFPSRPGENDASCLLISQKHRDRWRCLADLHQASDCRYSVSTHCSSCFKDPQPSGVGNRFLEGDERKMQVHSEEDSTLMRSHDVATV